MPEVRLIDVTIALEEIDKKIKKHDVRWLQDICERNGLIIARKILEKAPTIAAEPVKHAHWESWGFVFHGIEWKRCSACGKCAGVSYYGLLDGKIEMETPARCGCCGAKMQTEPPEEVQE